MSGTKGGREASGFSLIEVMTAMVITMIIVGSIYGLLTGGQKAFRREPERTELQQNLRSAMNFIMRDVASAGGGPGCDSSATVCDGIEDLFQPFTAGLDGAGPARPAGGGSDILQILYADPSCQPFPVDPTTLALKGGLTLPNCFAASQPSVVFLSTSDKAQTFWGLAKGITPGDNKVTFTAAQPPGANTAGAGPDGAVSVGKLVRYEICNAAGDAVPSLCRSETGGYDNNGTFQAAPSAAGNWQIVARGIEDLQVDYRSANTPADQWRVDQGPEVVINTDWTTITKEVRVTLAGRGTLTGIQGQSGPAGVVQTLRAQLVSTGSPRAALFWLLSKSKTPNPLLWSSWIQGSGAWS